MSKKGMQFGPYEVVEKIGQGGMGVVYRAHEARLNRDVALKILPERLATNPSFTKRFLREAQSAAGLEHPNIVGVHGVGEEKGTYWIAMQLVSGKPLSKLMEEGPMPWEKAADIGRQAAQALDYAHKHGVVHRDVKPDNLMVDEAGLVKVMDFGLAKAQTFDAKITESGVYVGTPEYSSPEQCESQDVDGRSDLYSLGVVLYEALSGQVPHSAETPFSLFKKIVDEVPRPIREINPEVPPSMAAIVEKLMQKDRGLRYQSASELLKDLDRVRGIPQTGVSERPGTEAPTRGTRAARRKVPVLYPAIGLAAAGLLAVVLTLALVPWGKGEPSAKPKASPGPAAPEKKEPGKAPAPGERPAVALVMDFQNIRNAEDLAWMRVGVPDMLITDLAQLKWLKVYSRDRVQTEMGKLGLKTGEEPGAAGRIAKALDADILLKGTFVGVGKDVKITIQALSYPAEEVILSDQALGPLDGLLGMIDDLTRRIRRGLSAQFRPGEGTQDMVEHLAALRDRLVEVSAARAELAIGGPSLADGSSVEDLLRRVEEGLKAKESLKLRRAASPKLRDGTERPASGSETEGAEGDAPAVKDAELEESLTKELAKSEEKAAAGERGERQAEGGLPAEAGKDRKNLEGAPAGGPSPTPAPAPVKPPAAKAGALAGRAGRPAPGADAGAAKPGSPANAPPEGREGWGAGEPEKDKEKPGEPLAELQKQSRRLVERTEIEEPKDPLTRAMVLVYRARDLREKSGGEREALREAAGLLREALAAFPGLPAAKTELAVLRAHLEEMGR